jgi:hypothetical protein
MLGYGRFAVAFTKASEAAVFICSVMYVLSVERCLDERQKQAHEGERCDSKQQLKPKG